MLKNRIARYLTRFFLCFVLIWPLTVQAQERIRITYASNSLAFLAAFVAKDRGFYAKRMA